MHQYPDFGKLFDALPIGILIADSNHRIYFWNRTFCKLHGLEDLVDEIYEQFGENFLIYINPALDEILVTSY